MFWIVDGFIVKIKEFVDTLFTSQYLALETVNFEANSDQIWM